MDKRLAVVVLVGLMIGGGVLLAVKLSAPQQLPPLPNPAMSTKLPAMPAVDRNLIGPTPRTEVFPFVDISKPGVKKTAALKEGADIKGLAFTPNSELLVACDYGDMSIRVWDWRAGKVISKQTHIYRPCAMVLSPDGRSIWTVDVHQNLYCWPLHGGELGAGEKIGEKLGEQLDVAISGSGRLLATVSFNSVLTLWDAVARKNLATLKLEEPLRKCAFSPDGARLVIGTNTNVIASYDLTTGQGTKFQIGPVKSNVDLMSLAFSPDGKRFSTGHNQPWLTMWQADSMKYENFLKCPETGGITSIAYSPDSAWVVFPLGAGEIHLWNSADAEATGDKAVFRGHEKTVWSLAFSPDGTTLASGDDGGMICVWTKAQ